MSTLVRRILFLGATFFMLTGSYTYCQAGNTSLHPWTLEYRDPSQKAVIKETGEIMLKLSYRSESFKATLDESDKSNLFKLAAEPEFQKSNEEYLAAEGTFSQPNNCNQLILKDAEDKLIHQVVYSPDSFPYSPQPKEKVPTIVKELTANIVMDIHQKFDFLFPKCGYQGPAKK